MEPFDFNGTALAEAGHQLKHGKLLIISRAAQHHHVIVLPGLWEPSIDLVDECPSLAVGADQFYGAVIELIHAHGDIYRL